MQGDKRKNIKLISNKTRKLGILPYDRESEAGILCCIILDNILVSTCLKHGLKPEDFFESNNQIIYEKMLELRRQNINIDFLTLMTTLKDYNIPPEYITNIAEYLPAPMNIEYFIQRVKNLARVRKYINIARQIEIISFETKDPEEIEKALPSLFLDAGQGQTHSCKPVSALLSKNTDAYETFAHGAKVQQRAIWGIVGATSAGKTEFALDLALSYTLQGINNTILFCEYEGTEEDLASRIQRKAQAESRWNTEFISTAMKPNFLQITDFVQRNKNNNILIIIDYLQRFARKLQADDTRPSENLRLYVNSIYNFFDNLRADNTNVSVCFLMSMSKQGINEVSRQKRADKIDLLNAIKESGDVQYDLDYSYAILFSEESNDDNLSLSRFGSTGKAKRYMHLYPVKEARIGEPLRESVYVFSAERYAYEMVESYKNTETVKTEYTSTEVDEYEFEDDVNL
ncbi:DnaB-like helicase N-terminal domain-containing protein [Hippea maritima]|uniref:DnaB domain protein helicase domain protein n=1 Tax=Hippea maritima (strain ATCC 700847 / DSM 10411 / MH2) TaxID=760142 RepID=F2LV72_HIPMA|nr:DnaB-like helicase N-terminal domain-containing protein [Hippea maritima]AEA33656.1 DnaB domain protein helicase domain protein [Hippea maritima DSM 10411]